MKLKKNGWAMQFDGSIQSAEGIAKCMYPGIATRHYERIFLVSSWATVRFRAPGMPHILTAGKGDWVMRYEDLYYVADSVPPEWLPDDHGSNFTRNIMVDWMNYR